VTVLTVTVVHTIPVLISRLLLVTEGWFVYFSYVLCTCVFEGLKIG